MKNFLLASLVVLALCGLGYIQYRLLNVGLSLEKGRFDYQMELTLQEVNTKIDQAEDVRKMLMRLNVQGERPLMSPEYLLPQRLNDSLQHWIHQAMIRNGMAVDFTFAVTESVRKDTLTQAADFNQLDRDYEAYQIALGGKLVRDCFCSPVLQVRVNQLFSYLLRQLAYLIVPSLLFILMLAISLFFLIQNLRQQEQLDQIKNDFINNLTHELKTPVFSIGLLTKLLQERVQGPKEREYLQLIDKENKQVQHHIEKVLELATLEGGQYQMEKQLVDVHQLLQDISTEYRLKTQDVAGELDLRLRATDYQLEVDPLHLRNAIQNLLENAIKYSLGSPKIGLTTNQNAAFLIIQISDEGIGIAPEHQARIFEKFYRVMDGDLHPVKGFGLGLSYVRQIVAAHGGHIRVASKLNQGTTFSLYFPLKRQAHGS